MLKEFEPFAHVWLTMHNHSRAARAMVSFARFMERRLGAEFVYDTARIAHEPVGLVNLFALAEKLKARGIIRSYGRGSHLADEVFFVHWRADCATERVMVAGGISADSQSLALVKTLAEAIERYTWLECTDQFKSLHTATVAEMEMGGDAIMPKRFAGYSDAQRAKNARVQIKPTSSFLWTKGYSWTQEKSVWIPVQIVSGHKKLCAPNILPNAESSIRISVTTGLAIHPVRTNALLSGALEVIERDAYMVTWMNQLSVARIDVAELSRRSVSLARLVDKCRRYRFEPHFLRLPTDAPAYVVCAVIEDTTSEILRFSIGNKAGRDPASAAEGALLEALRSRQGTRMRRRLLPDDWNPDIKVSDVVFEDRLLYWAREGYSNRLSFLIKGDIRPLRKEAWENDTDDEHFKRIVQWCREKGYELTSVSLKETIANVPNWHIEFVVIPELQPMHLNDRLPYLGGKRLKDIPAQFGYTALPEPYVGAPHPFA